MQPISRSIWPPHRAFYVRGMLFNSQSAARSIDQINAVFHVVTENSPEDPAGSLPVFYLLGELQNLVVQAAALSRYFWPAPKAHEWRGEELRAMLEVGDDSHLKNRDLRNAIEHFDEKLDHFLAPGPVGHFLPEYVGPFQEPSEVAVHLFRAYYTDTGVFELLGKRFEVQPLAAEVIRVHQALRKMDAPANGS